MEVSLDEPCQLESIKPHFEAKNQQTFTNEMLDIESEEAKCSY